MLRFVSCCMAVALVSVVQSQSCVVSLNGITYDFSSLKGTTFSANSATQPYTYEFTPCQNALTGPTGTPAMIGQFNGQGSPVAPVSIFDSTLSWSTFQLNNNTVVQFTTNNGAPPLCVPSNKPRFATIQFVCQQGMNQFTITNEPNLQGCPVAPGYTFTLTTPLACGQAPPPPTGCPYTLSAPCIISTFNPYAVPGGQTILFNQNGNQCGALIFSDYSNKAAPDDTCTEPSVAGLSNYYMISHLDISTFPKIIEMLQSGTGTNPINFFWNQDTDSGAIGPTTFVSDFQNILISNPKRR